MKRHGHIYEKIISIDNLTKADAIAQRGKKKQYGVITHNKNRAAHIQLLHETLLARNFKTSTYTTFTVYEPKERIVYSLPYFPDRILHHAIMLQLDPIFKPVFTSDTYSCIKGRGLHAAVSNLRKALIDVTGTTYCLKIDIRKYYPSLGLRLTVNRWRRDAIGWGSLTMCVQHICWVMIRWTNGCMI